MGPAGVSVPHHENVFPRSLRRIVSGGQTGVDRGGLETALALGLDHGGWCPAGRLAEDGSIPSRYQLRETDSSEYPVRTEQNVIDSDATLILYEGRLRGGSLLTLRLCRQWSRPHCVARVDREETAKVRDWLADVQPETLNVAGPRESSCAGIETRSFEFLSRVLTRS